MSFTENLVDVPGRVSRYRHAGYSQEKARELAHNDLRMEALGVLAADYAEPVSVEIRNFGAFPENDLEHDILEDKHQTALELAAVANAAQRYDIGCSDDNYKIVARIHRSLLANTMGQDVMPKMESIHAEAITPKKLTMHLEDAGNFSLKDMWTKLKQTFVKMYNSVKTWYIKAFDATQRLGNKAAAVKATAEGKQGTMNNTSFDFSGLKTLCMDGKVPEPANLTAVIQNMAATTQNVLGKTAESYNKLAENMAESLKNLIDQMPKQQTPANNGGGTGASGNNASANTTTQTANTNTNTGDTNTDFTANADNNQVLAKVNAEISEISKAFSGDQTLEEWTGAAQDKRFQTLTQNGQVKLYKTKGILPGDKMFVVSTLAIAAGQNVGAKDFTALKLAVGATVETISDKPRELDDQASFKTLATAQVVAICESVMDACKAGLDYKLLFAQRDKAFQNLDKQLDQTVQQADGLSGKPLTFVKSNVSACTTIFQKLNSGEGRWYRYSMGVFSKAIDYCQQSLNQIQ